MKLDAYLLLQAAFTFVVLSFMMSFILFSSYYVRDNYLHTQASLQLELYKQSAFLMIAKKLQEGSLIASNIPTTYDRLTSDIPQLFDPYQIEFNLLGLPDDYICIEMYLSILLPDGMLLQEYDSFLVRKGSLQMPKMPCRISIIH